jgi:hypothetical protein
MPREARWTKPARRLSGFSGADQGDTGDSAARASDLFNAKGRFGTAAVGELKAPVTILRPCDVYGTHSLHPREYWFVRRILARWPIIPLAFRSESRFHTSAVENIAALTRLCVEKPGKRIFNIADPKILSVAKIGAAIAHHMNLKGRFQLIDNDEYPPKIGATPWSDPAPFRLNTNAALAFCYQPVTGYERAIGAMCKWLVELSPKDWRAAFPVLASYVNDQFDYAAEDVFLQRMCAAKEPSHD